MRNSLVQPLLLKQRQPEQLLRTVQSQIFNIPAGGNSTPCLGGPFQCIIPPHPPPLTLREVFFLYLCRISCVSICAHLLLFLGTTEKNLAPSSLCLYNMCRELPPIRHSYILTGTPQTSLQAEETLFILRCPRP